MHGATLIINTGSTSRRYSLFDGMANIKSAHIESADPQKNYLTPLLPEWGVVSSQIASVGIRVVAPGKMFKSTARIDEHYTLHLREALSRAPLHIAGVLRVIEELEEALPDAVKVAVSDSKFHGELPDFARTYALPEDVREKYGIERQGYHGLSIASAISKIRQRIGTTPENIVLCHMGGGTSITALKKGVSLDTSMGWTPLEGVPMAERTGSIDPGIVAFLSDTLSLKGTELETFLSTECGLEAISGIDGGDMKRILSEKENGNAKALLAFQVYIHAVRKYIGAMAAVLGGCDSLVLTGTIAERSATVRQALTEGMEYLSIRLDSRKNDDAGEVADFETLGIGDKSHSIIVSVADETTEMLEETRAFLEK